MFYSTAFSRQQWLRERAWLLRLYVDGLSCNILHAEKYYIRIRAMLPQPITAQFIRLIKSYSLELNLLAFASKYSYNKDSNTVTGTVKSSGILRRGDWSVLINVSKDYSVFIFRVGHS